MQHKKLTGGSHVAMDDNDRNLLLKMLVKKLDSVDANITRSAEVNLESHAELFKELNGLKLTVEKNAHHSHKHCDDCADHARDLVALKGSVTENFRVRDENLKDRFAVRDRTAKIVLAILLASGAMSHFFL